MVLLKEIVFFVGVQRGQDLQPQPPLDYRWLRRCYWSSLLQLWLRERGVQLAKLAVAEMKWPVPCRASVERCRSRALIDLVMSCPTCHAMMRCIGCIAASAESLLASWTVDSARRHGAIIARCGFEAAGLARCSPHEGGRLEKALGRDGAPSSNDRRCHAPASRSRLHKFNSRIER